MAKAEQYGGLMGLWRAQRTAELVDADHELAAWADPSETSEPSFFDGIPVLDEDVWVEAVIGIHDSKIGEGEEPLLPDSIIYGTPGGVCFDKLAARGFRLEPVGYGVKVVPVEVHEKGQNG